VIHLSRNMAPAANWPGDLSRGNGKLIFGGVTVYMSSEGAAAPGVLNVLPREAGFTLELKNGVVFHASQQNEVFGNVEFNNTDVNNPVRINGAEAAPTPLTTAPYTYNLTDQTWSIHGTGWTQWKGLTEKIGTGTVEFNRQQGAAVEVASGTKLKITAGEIIARGTADPFTDTTSNLSLDVENNSAMYGLQILEGVKKINQITGTGDLLVDNNSTLYTNLILQGNMTVGAGSKIIILPLPPPPSSSGGTPVPEPSTPVLLALAALGALAALRRRKSA